MPYNRETLPEIRKRVLKSLDTNAFSFRGMLGTAIAGMSHMLHGHIDYLAKNMLPDSATGSVLDRWAKIWVTPRLRAVGPRVTIRVTGEPGSAVPRAWVVDGEDFVATTDDRIGPSRSVEVVLEGTKEPKKFATVEKASTKVASAVVDTEAAILARVPGVPQESDADLRRRFLETIQTSPQGGSYLDYIRWAESIPGVVQAWVKPWHMVDGGTPGSVHVTWLEAGLSQSAGVKTEIMRLIAQVAPAHALVKVFWLPTKIVNLNIKVFPDTLECRAEVRRAVMQFFESESKPGGFLDRHHAVTPALISKSRLDEAISRVKVEQSHNIANLSGDIPVADGEVVKCEVTFI